MKQNEKRKTILFVCFGGTGHVNAVTGLANHLREQGHRTCFLFDKPFKNNLQRFGHEIYDCWTPDLVESQYDESKPQQASVTKIASATRDSWLKSSAVEAAEQMCLKSIPAIYAEYTQEHDKNVAAKMELLRPDLLVMEHWFMYPALCKLGLPYVEVYSPAPLYLHNNNHSLPQPWLGLPTNWNNNDPIQAEWNERVKQVREKIHHEIWTPFWTSFGMQPTDLFNFFSYPAELRLYMYPEELDYEQPLVGWERYDYSIRDKPTNNFEVPQKLRDQPGKLILLSLGSLASADGQLMKRLTSMLADCPHRFIVVTGSSGHEYELPDNMWGEEYLPQLEILPIIDLIITHGGNNTVCESLYFGVPGMIVCPLFGDQYDNAQRVQETGVGIRLHPYSCTKEELHDAIEDLLSRPGLRERMQAISRRMQQPETRNRPLKLISEFVNNH